MKPSNFYFHIWGEIDSKELLAANDDYTTSESLNQILVAICPIDFFDLNGTMSDDNLEIENILPEDFEEICEGEFITTRSFLETRKILIEYGFQENEEFSFFMKEIIN